MKPLQDVLERLPEKLRQYLMPFQAEGVEFAVRKHGRCLIADEMGLGKTLQAISVAYYYRQEWPLLIIVPSSLRYSWIEEFEKWLPDINPGDINLVQSGNDVSDIGTAKVTITTYGLLSKATSHILREALMSQGFHVVIVDESHYIRNAKTVSAKTVVPLIKNANRRILLSGTPALARPVELYPQIDAVCPDEFGTWWTYTAKYCDAKLEWFGRVKRRNVNGASNLEDLQQRLSEKLMIRREKSEVLTQLPPKQRQRVLFELKDSDLKKEIRQTFDELRPLMKRSKQDNFEVLTGAGEHDAKDTNLLYMIQRLYKLSGTAKIGPAKEYVEMLCENPKLKFLVFAYHHDMMNGLSESLHDKKIKFIRIDGETPPSERPHLVQQFQSDPDTRVAILSILAAGVGLTLTAATLVVFAEMYWTPGTMIQCEDRAHRIGQTSCVAVHYLVARDTMDEWVWSAVCKKTLVTSATLTGKKREMEALDGDQYQVDVLSNAEAWVPASNSDSSNLTQYIETCLDAGQKSILHFFSPKQFASKRNWKSVSENDTTDTTVRHTRDISNVKTRRDSAYTEDHSEIETAVHAADLDCLTPSSKRIRVDSSLTNNRKDQYLSNRDSSHSLDNVIVIDSDGDNDFVDYKVATKSCKTHSNSSEKQKSSKVIASATSPRYSLKAVFEKARKNNILRENDDIDDEKIPIQCSTKDSKIRESLKTSEESEKNVEVYSERTAVVRLDGNVDEIWNCKQCTYLNHTALNYCEMCESPKKCIPVSKTTLTGRRGTKSGTLRSSAVNIKFVECKKELKEADNNNISDRMRSAIVTDAAINVTDNSQDDDRYAVEYDDTIDFDPCIDIDDAGSCQEVIRECVEMESDTGGDPGSDIDNAGSDVNVIRGNYFEMESDFVEDVGYDGVGSGCTGNAGSGCTGKGECDEEESDTVENSCSDINEIEKSVDVEDDYTIDEVCSPDSDGMHDGHCNTQQIHVFEENSHSAHDDSLGKADNEHSPYSAIDGVSSSEHVQGVDGISSSCYFNKTGLTTPCQVKKKEIVIENTLNIRTCAHKQQNGAENMCNNEAAQIECKTDSPISGKKYHFKSVRKDKSFLDQAVDSSPCANSDNKIYDENFSSRDTDSVKCVKSGEVHVGNIGKRDGCSFELGNSKTSRDIVRLSKTGPVSNDYSFSSPEVDDLLAAEADNCLVDDGKPGTKEKRVVDLDKIPVYAMFKYLCSKYTDRMYLLTQEEEPLNMNFIPSDIQFGNDDGLPDIFLHPDNMRHAQRFVREWLSLTETKRRLIVKSGQPFTSPLLQYERLKSCKSINTQRHKTKVDTSVAAHQKAKDINGSVRIISKHASVHSETSADEGITQAVSEDGTPLCLQCFQPYSNHLLQKSSIQDKNNAWNTRFCSRKCSQDYWMVSNNEFMRERVFEAEHGICQLCKFDAHSLFRQIRDTGNHKKRAEIISGSKFQAMTVKVKEQMVRRPAAGQFWHVDHIVPVWEGGGQCDIDNLRTLCVTCHQKVTARQAAKRATVKKLGSAVKSGDITAFFQRN